MHLFLVLYLVSLWSPYAEAQQGSECSAAHPCAIGCCSQYGSCGFGPAFCGTGCQANCNAQAECGQYSNVTLCPLNVCCSQYGFCGTTDAFCGAGCQNGCAPVDRPSCAADTNALDYKRRIAYYELFGITRPCDTMQPELIPAGALTHINLAFINFGSDFKLIDAQGDLVARVSRLQQIYPGLRVNIAVGGWNFNDPPSQEYFTNMASTSGNRATFINSVILYLQKYGLNGIDIDWEYPVAEDRGGQPADFNNYPTLLSEMRAAFNNVNPGWEISITLPSSYWYMRGFNLPALQQSVTYFNFMSYDLHGMWDFSNNYTGPYLLGHTNLTEIEQGMDLLWRNRVNPANVVMGMAFYGRSFTMADDTCTTPNGICQFSAAGIAGDCSVTPGILIYAEIQSSNGTINTETFYDPISTVKWNIFDATQWVSYDDEQSWEGKKAALSSLCLSGLMIWAIDQDTPQYDAITGLLGEDATQGALLQGGPLSPQQQQQLASQFAAYTGQNCYVTPVCTNGLSGNLGPNQVCAAGFSSMATAHAPMQIYPGGKYQLQGDCAKGWYRHVCCPTNALPKNCQWDGNPASGSTSCAGPLTCGDQQFNLATDIYTDAVGDSICSGGLRKLCCDSTEVLDQCFWTSCQGPFPDGIAQSFATPPLKCPTGSTFQTFRYDDDEGAFCSSQFNSGNEYTYARAYCCPNIDIPSNCSWSNAPNFNPNVIAVIDPASYCDPRPCGSTLVQYTTALAPPNSSLVLGVSGTPSSIIDCSAYPIPPGESFAFPYCCNPPEAYNEKWPVPPSYLWGSNAYDEEGSDVQWSYADNYGNNGMDTTPNPEAYGEDPYGFIMLDGPAGSLQSQFAEDFTFTHEAHTKTTVKRDLLTTNRTVLDSVFDHAQETVYVYCKHEVGSPRCKKIFYKGAADTIIRLPNYVGEGPFARVISMELADDEYVLADHHLRERSVTRNVNPVYKLKFDYNFHLIKRSETVNMRVDYTNLLPYWKDITDTPGPSSKRSVRDEHLTQAEWKARVRQAKDAHKFAKRATQEAYKSTQKRDKIIAKARSVTDVIPSYLGKRWFGDFVDWLSRMNNVESSAVGYLSMLWQKSILLYHAKKGCQSSTAYAELSVYLDSNINLEATYAYYLSGTIVPPAVTGTYAYFGIEPSAYLGLTVEGFAQLQYQSARVKLIDTISYPGLAIKGIAAVGPTLDVWGQITGMVQISGQMQIGFRFNFESQEWYWPDDSDSAKYQELLGLQQNPSYTSSNSITPEFQAAVQANAGLDIIVTPEANMGIKVGGTGTFGVTLVDAQIVAYVNSTLRFNAHADATIGSGSSTSYSYGYSVIFLYNIGYGAYASIPLFPWYATFHDLYNPLKQFVLYSHEVSSTVTKKRRSISEISAESIRVPRRGLLNSVSGDELSLPMGHASVENSYTETDLDLEHTGNRSMLIEDIIGLDKRQNPGGGADSGDTPDFSLWQFFDCPPTTSCPNCLPCASSTKRDVLEEEIGDEAIENSSTTQNLSGDRFNSFATRATGPGCPSILPDFRINCGIFQAAQANGNGKSELVEGICTNEQAFFASRGLPQTGLVLTYDGGGQAEARVDTRRGYACPKSKCQPQDTLLGLTVGYNPGTAGVLLSCDEFPFASVEEGGNYYTTLPAAMNPSASATTACTPVWQQNLQAQCNLIFGNMNTNVRYHDLQTTSDPYTSWNSQDWLDPDAAVRDGQGNPIFQRLAIYPQYQYPAAGIPAALYAANNNLGYMFKRNFTYGLAFPANANDGAAWSTNPANRFVSFTGARGTSTDATQVLCAMNLFGQDDIYSYDNYNAICLTGTFRNSGVFGNTVTAANCRVRWATNAGGNKKRVIGEFGGYDIESIEILEDGEKQEYSDIPLDVLDNLGPALPFKNVKENSGL